MEKTKPEEIKIRLQEIDLPKLDLLQFVGKKDNISKVTTLKGNYGPYLRVEGTVLDTLKGKVSPIEIKASRNFGLYQDANGLYGWGKETDLGLFLALKKCKNTQELVGKEITLQIENKDDKQFLTFI